MDILTSSPQPVPASLSSAETRSWQQAMKDAIRDPRELCQLLHLPPALAEEARAGAADFPVFVPREYLARMRLGDPTDPLLRQVLPLAAEQDRFPEDRLDPVGDCEAELSPGLLQKYQSRVLMVTSGACAVHCRYCFRRHFPYGQTPHSPAAWSNALAQIEADPSIREVILSGGDPLTLVDRHLSQLADQIAQIGHVQRLRIHTRLPIIIPQRVCDSLLDWLNGTRLTPIMVIHANHASEIDDQVETALQKLVSAGIPVLNQAVLLRGINDSAEALENLLLRLVDLRVMPYYLHQLDRVAGAAHFEVPMEEGLQLITALRARLPGYAVPRYVKERAGEPGKAILA